MKYFSKKVKYDGHIFDSNAEMERYKILVVQQNKGLIHSLELQKQFEIIPKLEKEVVVHLKTKDKIVKRTDEQPARYTCDFYYYDNGKCRWIVEELKSKQTAKLADYILRRKLIKKLIAETNKGKEDADKLEFVEIVSTPVRKKKGK